MNVYEKLPIESLIALYHEKMKDIENGLLTKNAYYELGLMISAASKKGITLGKTYSFGQEGEQPSNNIVSIVNTYPELKDVSITACEH